MALIGQVGFREKDLLKTVDNERTDDGSWSSYISSPCQPHGSGELVRNLLQIQPNFPTLGWLPILTHVCDISLFRRDLPIFQQISLFRISKFPYIYNVYISLFEINNFLLCLIILPISKSNLPIWLLRCITCMILIKKQKERKVPAKLLLYNWVLYSVLNAIIISYPKF